MPLAQRNRTAFILPVNNGIPRTLADANHKTVWHWDSDPFGVGQPDEDPDGDGNKVVFDWRFPGQVYDAETGVFYNYFRDGYEAGVGRYTQSDPIGLDGGINSYVYAENNPTTEINALGLAPGWNKIGQKAIDVCKKLPSCKQKLDELEKKAKELCKRVECKLYKDREGHPFIRPDGKKQLCAHYQIDCWIEGGGGSFSRYWGLPAFCWSPKDKFPIIEWQNKNL